MDYEFKVNCDAIVLDRFGEFVLFFGVGRA